MKKLMCLFLSFSMSGAYAANYPNMEGVWVGTVRTVSFGDQVRSQVARGGALIQVVELKLTVTYQDQEVFMGESIADLPDAQPVPVWGAIRSTATRVCLSQRTAAVATSGLPLPTSSNSALPTRRQNR